MKNCEKRIEVTVNETIFRLKVGPGIMLVDLLRDQLRLTGTKVGCRRGECGACTVLIDGKPILSCMYPAIRADRKKIVTIEGLKVNDGFHPLQKAFIQLGAVQCGYCTPGMIMSSKGLLDENPNPSLNEVQEALSGNLCRCGGYQKIFEAVLTAIRETEAVK